MTRETDIEGMVGAVATRLREGLAHHPESRVLGAYLRQELAAAEMLALQDHLTLCPECSELVLDLSDPDRLAGSPEAGEWEARKPQVWKALQADLVDSDRALVSGASRTDRRSRSGLMLLAALLAVFVTGAVWQALKLSQMRQQEAETGRQLVVAQSTIRELEERAAWLEPQVIVPRLDLFPPGYQRGQLAVPILELPSQARLIVLQLHAVDFAADVDYHLRIRSDEGEVWTGTGLRSTVAGAFRVALPRSLLPPGRYRLEISVAGKAPLLSHYDLEVADL